MANHGYINRNGKNITKSAYQDGFLKAFNIAYAVTKKGVNAAFTHCSEATGAVCNTLDLDFLNIPHSQEHDASLTRSDDSVGGGWENGDNHDFNTTVWDYMLAVVGDATHISASIANTMRLTRVAQAQVEDTPGWFVEEVTNSVNEAAFYLSVMHDPTLGLDRDTDPQARADWVDYWFANERLPTVLGWIKPTAKITNLAAISSLVQAAPTIPASGVVGSTTVSITTSTTATPTSFLSSSTVVSSTYLTTSTATATTTATGSS